MHPAGASASQVPCGAMLRAGEQVLARPICDSLSALLHALQVAAIKSPDGQMLSLFEPDSPDAE